MGGRIERAGVESPPGTRHPAKIGDRKVLDIRILRPTPYRKALDMLYTSPPACHTIPMIYLFQAPPEFNWALFVLFVVGFIVLPIVASMNPRA